MNEKKLKKLQKRIRAEKAAIKKHKNKRRHLERVLSKATMGEIRDTRDNPFSPLLSSAKMAYGRAVPTVNSLLDPLPVKDNEGEPFSHSFVNEYPEGKSSAGFLVNLNPDNYSALTELGILYSRYATSFDFTDIDDEYPEIGPDFAQFDCISSDDIVNIIACNMPHIGALLLDEEIKSIYFTVELKIGNDTLHCPIRVELSEIHYPSAIVNNMLYLLTSNIHDALIAMMIPDDATLPIQTVVGDEHAKFVYDIVNGVGNYARESAASIMGAFVLNAVMKRDGVGRNTYKVYENKILGTSVYNNHKFISIRIETMAVYRADDIADESFITSIDNGHFLEKDESGNYVFMFRAVNDDHIDDNEEEDDGEDMDVLDEDETTPESDTAD